MDERRQRRPVNGWVEAANECRGPRAHHLQQRFDRLQHAGDTAERERRRAEADDLPVVARGVPPHDVNGIERGIDVVERAVDGIEPLLQPARQNAVIGTPSRHSGHELASWFSGALYSASATLGTPASTTASIRS